MNRNNILINVALAFVLILVAAFAGQLRKWQTEWPSRARIVPETTKIRERQTTEILVDETPAHREAEILVKFRANVTQQQIAEITSSRHDEVEDRIEIVPGLEAIDDLDDAEAAALVSEYTALPEVEYAEENSTISLDHEGAGKHIHSTDPMLNQQWALANDGQKGGTKDADIRAMQAWAITTGSNDIVVAVLDSGVDYNHTDLANNIWHRPSNLGPYQDAELGTIDDVNGYNAIVNSGDPFDDNGHGTHCAGIIGAEGDNNIGIAGVNWHVQIMPLKFMNAGGFGSVKDAIEAINYVIKRKQDGVNVRIINASWGFTQRSRALEDAIRKANEAGILFVAASGNSSVDTDRRPHFPANYNVPNVISVAALDRHDQLAPFSNYGARTVHVAAPGREILSTWLGNDYEERSGTSMATPMVSGVAALVLSKYPELTIEQLRRRLLESVDKLPQLQGKIFTGGRINAAKAVAE